MSYSIRVLNSGASTEVGKLQNIVDAEVYEVINDQYTADVEIAENKFPPFLQYPNLLEIEGDYFIIAGIDKQRNNSKSIKLNLEHISYLLNDPFAVPYVVEGEEEIYEGSPGDILPRVWGMGAFQLVDLAGGYYQYRPSAKGGRSRINEFARQNGLEVEYKQFSVIIHPQRGANKGLVLEVGKNIESIQQKIDLNDNFALEYAHEVEIIDFSKMTGAQKRDIASAELGDTVTMIDTDLAIHAVERIVGKRYNPLFKEIPQLDVGQIIRDYVSYEEEKKDEKEEEDKGLLAQFKAGKIDCLALEDKIDAKSAVLDYIKDTSLQGVIPSADVELTENQTGVVASLKPDYSSHKLTAIITTETDSGLTTNFYELPDSALSSLVLPQQNLSVSVTLVVTKEPFADLVNGKVPIVESGENATFLEAYGVRFLINDNADGFLEHFKIGTVDALTFDDIECTGEVKAYIKGQKLHPHALWEYETEKLKGIYASLKEQYKNHHLTFIHTKVVAGKTTTEIRKMPFANARITEVPTAKDDSVIMVVTKEPFESLAATNIDKTFIKAFGIRFKMAEKPWLEEFKIGGEDCINLPGLDITQQAGEGEPKGAVLELSEKVEIITIKVNADYKSYFKQVMVWDSDTPITLYTPPTHMYSSSDFDNTGKLTIKTPFPNAKNGRIAILISAEDPMGNEVPTSLKSYMIDVTKANTDETGDYWLSEFRIGDVDCLALPGVQIASANAENIIAEIGYTSLYEHRGIFFTLKEEYVGATVVLRELYSNGTYEDIPQKGNDFGGWTYPFDGEDFLCDMLALIITNGTETQCFGVKFVKTEPEIPGGGGGNYRNIELEAYRLNQDEESNMYFSVLRFFHKDFEYGGEILGTVEKEVLTGFINLQLEGFSGGTVEYYFSFSEFGTRGVKYDTPAMTVTLPAGNVGTPMHFSQWIAKESEMWIWVYVKINGSFSNVNVFPGVLHGVINYISYTIG